MHQGAPVSTIASNSTPEVPSSMRRWIRASKAGFPGSEESKYGATPVVKAPPSGVRRVCSSLNKMYQRMGLELACPYFAENVFHSFRGGDQFTTEQCYPPALKGLAVPIARTYSSADEGASRADSSEALGVAGDASVELVVFIVSGFQAWWTLLARQFYTKQGTLPLQTMLGPPPHLPRHLAASGAGALRWCCPRPLGSGLWSGL